MKIGVLTSSRADFGIYLPLLKKMRDDLFFELEIIAFGTHLSSFYGNTVQEIINQGFNVNHRIESMLLTDSAESVSTAIGLTIIKFSDFWKRSAENFDVVFCLGDRYEMYAAVIAGIPFNIEFAHLHGGETTLGAIDNVFRHSITLASKYHFVAAKAYQERVSDIVDKKEDIYYVGALGLDNIISMALLSLDEFFEKWGIDLSKKTILATFHPETISAERNKEYIKEIINVIDTLSEFQVLVTMPNADTSGSVIRRALIEHFGNSKRVFLIENLGSQSYFSAMKYCSFLLGNTSSGIIEAASFDKYVINLGSRQKGRLCGDNVFSVPIKKDKILEVVNLIRAKTKKHQENIYYNGGAVDKIIENMKKIAIKKEKL